jgi:hypothetical protein
MPYRVLSALKPPLALLWPCKPPIWRRRVGIDGHGYESMENQAVYDALDRGTREYTSKMSLGTGALVQPAWQRCTVQTPWGFGSV